ncbi:helix-turn-helix domain-containing protein [Weissella confusa]|uniref:Helix-turn-helix domain-containing protein n=1 Tax=Weissella confusa TaxID=1583 RepID=A0A923SMT0_WEICO|nr:helix-turn-helix domain-containing protein [Weissella confusa]
MSLMIELAVWLVRLNARCPVSNSTQPHVLLADDQLDEAYKNLLILNESVKNDIRQFNDRARPANIEINTYNRLQGDEWAIRIMLVSIFKNVIHDETELTDFFEADIIQQANQVARLQGQLRLSPSEREVELIPGNRAYLLSLTASYIKESYLFRTLITGMNNTPTALSVLAEHLDVPKLHLIRGIIIMEWLLGKKEIKKVALVSYFYETNQTKMLIPDLERHFNWSTYMIKSLINELLHDQKRFGVPADDPIFAPNG